MLNVFLILCRLVTLDVEDGLLHCQYLGPGEGGHVRYPQADQLYLDTVQYKDLEANSTIDVSSFTAPSAYRDSVRAELANSTSQDLILFPGDATFAPVAPTSRVYVLRFTSSSARHFYWMQDVESTNDSRRAARVNALIDNPEAPEQADESSAMEGVTS